MAPSLWLHFRSVSNYEAIMLDHTSFLQSLSPQQRIGLTKKTNAEGCIHLALHVVALVIVGVPVAMEAVGWPVALLPLGILLVFLFPLLHEATHKTPFRSATLNTVVAHICGFILIIPPVWFRYFHFAHHRYTQDSEKDPELAKASESITGKRFWWHVSGMPLWVESIKILVRNAAGQGRYGYVPSSAARVIQHESRAMICGYLFLLAASLLLGESLLLYLWLIPLLLGQPFLRIFLMAEHGRCPRVKNMLENTRTTYTNALIRRLAWNMSFHAEHHILPTVPFHRLPNLNQLTRQHLKTTSNGYWRFHQSGKGHGVGR